MESQKSYKKRHQEYLDQQWQEKHPNGQFAICRHKKETYVSWIWARPTAGVSRSVSAIWWDGELKRYFYCAVGKVTKYESLEKFLKACKKYDVPERQVEFLLDLYRKIKASKECSGG